MMLLRLPDMKRMKTCGCVLLERSKDAVLQFVLATVELLYLGHRLVGQTKLAHQIAQLVLRQRRLQRDKHLLQQLVCRTKHGKVPACIMYVLIRYTPMTKVVRCKLGN